MPSSLSTGFFIMGLIWRTIILTHFPVSFFITTFLLLNPFCADILPDYTPPRLSSLHTYCCRSNTYPFSKSTNPVDFLLHLTIIFCYMSRHTLSLNNSCTLAIFASAALSRIDANIKALGLINRTVCRFLLVAPCFLGLSEAADQGHSQKDERGHNAFHHLTSTLSHHPTSIASSAWTISSRSLR